MMNFKLQRILTVLTASLLLTGSSLFSMSAAEKKAWKVVDTVDARHYSIQKEASSFRFEFKFNGIQSFLDKNLDKEKGEKAAPLHVEWKRKYGRNVIYRSELPPRLKQPAILIAREYKDIYLQPSLRQSLTGYKLAMQQYKNGERHLRAILTKKSSRPKMFFRVDLVIGKDYKVKRMALFANNGATITQTWDVIKFKGKYVPTKVTTVNKFQKVTMLRKVLYRYRNKNGFYFPEKATIRTRTGGTSTKVDTLEFADISIQ
jgi:hypothetical protein